MFLQHKNCIFLFNKMFACDLTNWWSTHVCVCLTCGVFRLNEMWAPLLSAFAISHVDYMNLHSDAMWLFAAVVVDDYFEFDGHSCHL